MEIRDTFIAFIAIIEVFLGFYVMFRGRRDSTSRFFAVFATLTGFWVFVNSLNYTEFFVKAVYFIAPLYLITGLLWIDSFSEKRISKYSYYLLYGVSLFLGAVIYYTNSIVYFNSKLANNFGGLTGGFGPLYPIYATFFLGIIIYILFFCIKELKSAVGTKRTQLALVFWGVCLFCLSGALIDFILPIFGITSFISYDVLTSLFFVAFSAYSILKYNLFNIKIAAVEFITFLIWVILFFKLFDVNTFSEFALNLFIFIITVVLGLLLIQNVYKEVEQREKIEKIAEELELANEHLRVLDKQKSEFVSIASHQLRTPLTAIIGYSSMLLEGSYGKLSDKATEVVDKVYQSSRRLAGTIDDFLTISHIEQGKMVYTFTTVEMRGLLSGMVEEFSTRAKDEKKELRFTDDGNGNYNVTADDNKIRQVLSNLIDNAIKYSKEGQSIEVSLTKDFMTNKTRISIHDSGIGMSSETINNLFQKFNRAKDVQKTYADGNGIGLYIAQEMMKSHHGKIWAESEGEGKGATFFVELMSEE